MNIIDHLTTPGNFVLTPKGERACIRSFNATTNEVEVTTGDPALGQNLSVRTRSFEDFAMKARELGIWRTYHFDKLRVAPDQIDV